MQSNSTKLIDETNHVPFDIDGELDTAIILREEDTDGGGGDNVRLSDIPAAPARATKRRRGANMSDAHAGDSGEYDGNNSDAIDIDSDAERPVIKRARIPSLLEEEEASDGEEDDKKKLAMDVSYEGFAIYGRVLCLVVRRRGHNTVQRLRQDGIAPEGQANMENWITSTQIPVGEDVP